MTILKNRILKFLYLKYLNNSQEIRFILSKLQMRISPLKLKNLPPLIWDLFLFWNNNSKVIDIIIYLYLKYKYSPKLQEFTIPRYNVVWGLRRNFFLRNLLIYDSYVSKKCIKFYLLYKQYLDDIEDYKKDSPEKHITPLTNGTVYISQNNFRNLFYIYYKDSTHLCSHIMNFYLQLG